MLLQQSQRAPCLCTNLSTVDRSLPTRRNRRQLAGHAATASKRPSDALRERRASGSLCCTASRVGSAEEVHKQISSQNRLFDWVDSFFRRRFLGNSLALSLALMSSTLPAARADLETVAPSTALNAARPLPEQKVDKGRVWVLFVGGAVTLFGGTVLLENFEGFFPAIAKSNQLMAASKKKEQEQAEAALRGFSDARLEEAVARGLAEARQSDSSDGKRPTRLEANTGASGSLPAPDSLEASESDAIEETFASTHQ